MANCLLLDIKIGVESGANEWEHVDYIEVVDIVFMSLLNGEAMSFGPFSPNFLRDLA